MKISFLIFLISLFSISCNKVQSITDLEKKWHLQNMKSSRSIASSNLQNSCYMDNIDEKRIVEDINYLTTKGLKKINTRIESIDLSKFEANEANYIIKTKEWLQTQNINFSKCSDVKCVYNKIYNNNGPEGLFHYFFYLKTGYILSSKHALPSGYRVSGKMEGTLFSLDELKRLYSVAKNIPKKFQFMGSLQSIHRFPRGYVLPDSPNACGVSVGYKNHGFILLMDNCIDNQFVQNLSKRFIEGEISMIHEITHRYDSSLIANNLSFSETKTWLDFSGWFTKEYRERSRIIRQWDIKTNSSNDVKYDDFISEYSKTHPAEDFAESSAYFRIDGESLLNKSPRKFDWIKNNIYGHTYDRETLNKFYQDKVSQQIISKIPDLIGLCLKDKNHFTVITEFPDGPGVDAVDSQTLNCLWSGIQQHYTQSIAELSYNDRDSCGFFQDQMNTEAFKSETLQNILALLKSDIKNNVEIGKKTAIFSEFIENFNNEVDPRDIFISCLENEIYENRKACFNDRLNNALAEKSTPYLEIIPNQIEKFKSNYLETNQYTHTENRTNELFKQMYYRVEIKFREAAKRKWDECFNLPQIQEQELEDNYFPYSGDNLFISRKLASCLNNKSLPELQIQVNSLSKKIGLEITNKNITSYITQLYLPYFISELKKQHQSHLDTEKRVISDQLTSISDYVANLIASDLSWLDLKYLDPTKLKLQCQQKSIPLINRYFDEKLNGKDASFNFHLYKDFNTLLADNVCENILSNNEFKSEVQKTVEKNVTKSYPLLKIEALNAMISTGELCSKLHSTTPKRNECFKRILNWRKVTYKAYTEWIKSFNNPPQENKKYLKSSMDYLNAEKSALVDMAIDKMNNDQ